VGKTSFIDDRKKKTTCVAYADKIVQGESMFVYKDEKQVINAYKKLKNRNQILDLVNESPFNNIKYIKIYIPSNIMEISNDVKKVVENDFGVAFHKNEYKRIILAHLSNSQDVYFYEK